MGQGIVLTIDYGHTAKDYYDPRRKDGTLLCYHRHSVNPNPYLQMGDQDITAHVNFSALAVTGERAGLSVVGFSNLTNFLIGLGVEQMVGNLEPESKEVQSAIQILRPNGMGQTFKVLIQQKGMESPSLRGLRFRPFFDSALLGQGTQFNEPEEKAKSAEEIG